MRVASNANQLQTEVAGRRGERGNWRILQSGERLRGLALKVRKKR
jgi:hypothetical protein